MRRHQTLPFDCSQFFGAVLVAALVGQAGSHRRAPAGADSVPALPIAMSAAAGPPEGLEAEDWEKIESRVREAEYRISRPGDQPDDESTPYQAFNRAHNLRTSFSEAGISLQPVGESEPGWDWGLSLTGYGYEGAIEPAGAAVLWAEGNRIEYRRGNLTEWYVNDARGLEQGFTLAAPPAVGRPGTLLLELRTMGGLTAVQESERSSIVLTGAGGTRVLRYSGLVAWDASGQELPAEMTSGGGRIVIRVRDEGAAYPLTIDPLLAEVKKLTPSDGAGRWFGWSVAISGDTVVVGACATFYGMNSITGSAYVFERNHGGANNWGEVKKLTASDASLRSFFAFSVAVSGDTLVVGAYGNAPFQSTPGSAYVFERNQGGANNWGEVKKLTASDAAVSDTFGYSVAISGGTVVVGTLQNTNGAYVFERDQGGTKNWGEVKKLTTSDALSFNFGWSVAVSGDTVLVGALDLGAIPGAVFVFERNVGGAGNYGEIKKLTASDAVGGDLLGWRLAISGDTFVVSAPANVFLGSDNLKPGSAYVFERNQGGANNWGEVKKLTASDAGLVDQFGFSVAISGDTLVVGSPFDDDVCPADPEMCNSGSAYVFKRNQGGTNSWGEVEKLTASDAAFMGWFGISVSISGDTVMFGSRTEPIGSAYMFRSLPPALHFFIGPLPANR